MTTAKRRASNSASSGSTEQQQQQQHLLHNQQQHQYYGQPNSHQQQNQYSQDHHQRHHHHSTQHHHHHQQQQYQNQEQSQQSSRDCSVKLPLDILWLPKSAMRPVGPDTAHTDCILVVGVSRPKLAVVFLTVMLISLFLTFHVLYDSAVYNIQAAQAMSEHHRRLSLLHRNSLPDFVKPVTAANQISHPMVFPSNRVHFPKTSRRLPQALIIGIRKCGTRALLEMLYLHPNIQKAGGEVHFFDRDENYMKGLEWYRKKMPHSFRGQITIEKSPSYFVSAEVPERVRAMNASIKLLLIVREPVTRAISDYTQLRSHAATATLPLADSVDKPSSIQASVTKTFAGGTVGSSGTKGAVAPSFSKSQSLLFSKLNGYSSAQVYDNSIDAGGGAPDGGRDDEGGGVGAGGFGDIIDLDSDSSKGYISNTKHLGHRTPQHHSPTPPSLTSSSLSQSALAQAQIAAKSFEELAIFPNGTVNDSYRPLSISLYHLHLHRWLEVFPREQLHIVNGDRLIEDPVSELKKIETFLGIEHRVTSSHFYFNETKGFYCLRYDNGDRCLRETKGRKHPHVDPVVVSKLRKFFAEHNQRFYELIGEDLGWPEE